MTVAEVVASTILEVTYSEGVTAAPLEPSAFATVPTGTLGIAIIQTDQNHIQITFAANIAAEGQLTYSGMTPGFVSPQTLAIT